MFKKNVISGLFLQVWKVLFKLIFSVLVARVVGNVTYGQITYFFVVFNMISSYGHLGVINGATFFAHHDKCDLNVQFNTNMLYLLLNSIVFGALFCFTPIGELVLPETSLLFIFGGILYVLFYYFYTVIDAYYVAQEKVFKSNLYMAVGMGISMLGMLLCFFFGKISMTSYIILQIVEISVATIMAWKKLGLTWKPHFDFSFLKREFRFGNIIFWASLFGYLNYRVDQFMIKHQLGDGELGVYSVAVTIAELVLLIPNGLVSSITGKLLNMKEEAEKKNFLAVTVKCCFYLCLLLVVGGILLSPLIEIVYGNSYHDAVFSFIILMLGISGAAVGKVIYPYYVVRGQVVVHLCVAAFTMVSNVVFNFFLIPVFGIHGAAMASMVSYLIYGGVYMFLLVKKERISLKQMLFISKEDIEQVKRGVKRHENRIL